MLQVAFPQVDPRAREEARGRGQGHFRSLAGGKVKGPPVDQFMSGARKPWTTS